jgi:SAM-dependent methyltransferase
MDNESSPYGRLPGADLWGSFYKKGAGSRYPDENLVRLLRGHYAPLPRTGRALDVGFGTGSNLILLAQSGYEAHGVEVAEECLETAGALGAETDVTLSLKLIRDTVMPYPDNYFDLVIAWNSIYYHGSRSRVADALAELHRVLRPNGVLLLSVIHPNSSIVHRFSDDLGDGVHRIDKESPHDNRHGITIFYEARSSGWRSLLASFDPVEEGYAEADLFIPKRRDAWRLLYAKKPAAQR